MLRQLAPLALAWMALACKPPASSFDAGCYPAPISYPSHDGGSGTSNCIWTAGCGSGSADTLTAQFHSDFNSHATCSTAEDCALYGLADGGSLYQCLDQLLSSYCGQCFDAGGLVQGDVSPPQDAGSCIEVECVQGQCNETAF
jgi:hypothetical protein